MVEEVKKLVPRYIEDFEVDASNAKEVLSRKSAFLREFGLGAFENLVTRSILRKRQAKK
ncbi:MAG: hypothetical protein ABSF66_00835 [Terriglobales bacterium]|jgi:hypothetical protein